MAQTVRFIAALLFAPLFHSHAQHLGRICAASCPRLFEYLRHTPETDAGKWLEWISAFDTHAVLAVSRVFFASPRKPARPEAGGQRRAGGALLCRAALAFCSFFGSEFGPPLKTALSHGFIGLGASKTGAEKRACGPGCGRRKGAGETRKRRGRNVERVRKEFGNGGRKTEKWCGENIEKRVVLYWTESLFGSWLRTVWVRGLGAWFGCVVWVRGRVCFALARRPCVLLFFRERIWPP